MSSDHMLKPPGTLPEQVTPRPAGGPEYCPHLAMVDDPDTHLLYPDGVHVCRARGQARPIDLEHQKRYCLSSLHRACRRYVPPSAPRGLPQRQLVAYEGEWLDAEALKPAPRPISFWRVLGWALLGSAFILVAIYLAGRILTPTQTVVREVGQLPTRTLTPSPTRATTPTPSEAVTPTAPALAIVAQTPTPTPPPGGANYVLSPAAGAVGWVVSSEDRGNHFGDSNIYSGAFEGRVYHGALQFDVSTIPRGGDVTVDMSADGERVTFTLAATGINANVSETARIVFGGQVPNGRLDAHSIQPYYTYRLARSLGMGVRFEAGEGNVRIEAGPAD